MWPVIVLILKIFHLWLQNSFEKNAEEKKRKEDMRVEAKEAVKSGNSDRIADSLTRLRNQ